MQVLYFIGKIEYSTNAPKTEKDSEARIKYLIEEAKVKYTLPKHVNTDRLAKKLGLK